MKIENLTFQEIITEYLRGNTKIIANSADFKYFMDLAEEVGVYVTIYPAYYDALTYKYNQVGSNQIKAILKAFTLMGCLDDFIVVDDVAINKALSALNKHP